MKKLLIVLALAVLALIALSPVLRAAKPGYRPASGSSTYHPPSHRPASYKAPPSRYSTTAKSTYSTTGKYSYRSATASYAGRNYAHVKSVKFRHGVYYAGKANYHWTKRTWNRTWGVWLFYCPVQSGWYYWCDAQTAYYPVAVIATYRPTEDVLPAPEQTPPPGRSLRAVPPADEGEEPTVP